MLSMDKDEFNRIKEEEKAHLRKLKELKQALHSAQRQGRAGAALTDMDTSSRDLLDAASLLTEEMNRGSAHQEARMDLALESEAGRKTVDPEEADAELRRLRAQELVRRMREELPAEESKPEAAIPQKTLGAKAPPEADSPAEEPAKNLPDKTIGRRRP